MHSSTLQIIPFLGPRLTIAASQKLEVNFLAISHLHGVVVASVIVVLLTKQPVCLLKIHPKMKTYIPSHEISGHFHVCHFEMASLGSRVVAPERSTNANSQLKTFYFTIRCFLWSKVSTSIVKGLFLKQLF